MTDHETLLRKSFDVARRAHENGAHPFGAILVDADGKAQLHKVSVARYLTGKVIISDGLKGGERVVVAGGQLLHPGMLVEIAQPPDPAQAQGVQP